MTNKKLLGLSLFFCFFLSILAYGEVVFYYFTDVDTFSLINDGRFGNIRELLEIFNSELMAGRMINAIYYRPLTSLIFGLEHRFFGLQPMGYHAVDLGLFMGTVFLMLLMARKIWGPRRGVLIGSISALLFIAHPVLLDDVPAIARMGDLLATFLVVASLFSIFSFVYAPSKACSQKIWYALSVLFSLLGLCAKEPAMIAPAVCGIAIFLFRKETTLFARLKTTILLTLPYGLTAALFFLWRWRVISGLGGYVLGSGKFSESFFSSYRTKSTILGHIFGFFLPNFSDHFDRYAAFFFERNFLIYPIFFLGCVGLIFSILPTFQRLIKNHYEDGEAENLRDVRVAWIFGAFLVVHFVLLLGTFFATRYLYLPLTALSLLLALLIVRLLEGKCQTHKQRVLAVLILAIFICMYGQSPLWSKEKLRRWQMGGEITKNIVTDLGQIVRENPAQKIRLLNIPYLIAYGNDSPVLWEIPFNQILLEHALVDYVELLVGHGQNEIMVLNYLVLTGSAEICEIETQFVAADEILVHVKQGGVPSNFPWTEIPGRQKFDGYFEIKGGRVPFQVIPEGGWSKEMTIQLKPIAMEQSNARFFAFDGQGLAEIVR